MNRSRSLPVLLPRIEGQRWSCHSCGNCCRSAVVHLMGDEREHLDRAGWSERLGAIPYVRVGKSWVLNKREDGACVFLDDDTKCRIHAESGEDAKPLACRIFPFSVRPAGDAWQSSLRFDCPSVVRSEGLPLARHESWLRDVVARLSRAAPDDDDPVDLAPGLPATADETRALCDRLVRWLRDAGRPMTARLIGAARLTGALHGATLKQVRGARFIELLDLLFGALPPDCDVGHNVPTGRQGGMLRQLAFAHAEHVHLHDMLVGPTGRMRRRWRQFRSAGRFRAGSGPVPDLPGFAGGATFDEVESVSAAADNAEEIDATLLRYLTARIESRSVFGAGYYGWPMFAGLTALWLSTAVTGWLARRAAAGAGRTALSYDDVSWALGVVDRAATRLPALGSVAERARVAYLLRDDGTARLVQRYELGARR